MRLKLTVLPNQLAICRLATDAAMPSWVRGTFVSATRTPDELSLVCDEEGIPREVNAQRGYRAIQVMGPIPFEATGIAASLVAPLAQAKISVFTIATYETDYVLVKEDVLDAAMDVLRVANDFL
ncbi:MAG TPA: ACT domain-containing protein [Thermoanaerobaculia bacterium]|nr:ACT domain-containing protein [Thermoanaerobaculia bacterium]